MGLDIILALFILAAGVRGWLRGFVIQAIRLAGLVGCIYAATPVRDAVRPYVAGYFPSLRPEMFERILWWSSAVVTYVVTVGLASIIVKMKRKRPFGETEENRGDQFGGFLLGGIKGALIAVFLVSCLQKYVVPRVTDVSWADEQAKSSYALKWDGQYHPAEKVWNSQPVQHFVAEVKRMGMPAKAGTAAENPAEDLKPAEDAMQAAKADSPPKLGLELPRMPTVDPGSANFTREFDRLFEEFVPKP